MQQLIYFLQKYKFFLFFLVLEFIAIVLTINNNSFHKSKFLTSANAITGGILKKTSKVSNYFSLQSENETLLLENARLRNFLETQGFSTDSISETTISDSLSYKQKYKYIEGKVYKNQYHKAYNFITLNRGKNHGVNKEMAVINGKGILGITDHVTNNYTRVQSILNRDSKINARFKNSYHFGTLTWNGEDYNTVQLTDIPRQATYKLGDTIITGGRSTIFPENIPIGTVVKIPEKISASNTLDVKLFNDMSNIGHAYIIINMHKQELKEIENTTNE